MQKTLYDVNEIIKSEMKTTHYDKENENGKEYNKKDTIKYEDELKRFVKENPEFILYGDIFFGTGWEISSLQKRVNKLSLINFFTFIQKEIKQVCLYS